MNKGVFKANVKLLMIAAFLIFIILKIEWVFTAINRVFDILKPLILGGAIAFVLNKPYKRFLTFFKGVNRLSEAHAKVIAIIVTYASFVIVLSGIIGFIVPQFMRSMQLLLKQSDQYLKNVDNLVNTINAITRTINFSPENINQVLSNLPKVIGEYASKVMPDIYNFATGVLGTLTNVLLGGILSIYILLDKERLKEGAYALLKAYVRSDIGDNVIYVATLSNATFSNFIIGQITEAFILGTLCFIGMLIFRFEYALFISVIVAVTSLVPLVGYFVGLVPSTLLLLIVNPIQAVWFLVFFVVLQQIENNFIYPRVVGNSVGLPALWVLTAIIIFGGFFGLVGMLIGIPLFSVIYKLILEDVKQRHLKHQL